MSDSQTVLTWSADGGARTNSFCELSRFAPPPEGTIPTVVIARTAGTCTDATGAQVREYKGVVYYATEPVAWYCVGEDEIPSFKQWATATFASMQLVTAHQPTFDLIRCPPPPLAKHAANDEAARVDPDAAPPADAAQPAPMYAEIKQALEAMAIQWFVPPTPVAPRAARPAAPIANPPATAKSASPGEASGQRATNRA